MSRSAQRIGALLILAFALSCAALILTACGTSEKSFRMDSGDMTTSEGAGVAAWLGSKR